MIKHLTWILIIIFLAVSCTTPNSSSQEEILQKTIVSIVNQELALTPSQVPPSETPTVSPTETQTEIPTSTITSTPTPEPTSDLEDITPIEGYGPFNFPPNINPLTGRPVRDPTKLDRRPLSVKISNYPRGVRPQWGLSKADHVFEYYAEAGLTRFNAIFYSNDATQIGPIRSARFSDKDIVEMYKAFFAYASADWRVRDRLRYSDFTDRLITVSDYPCPPTEIHPLCRIDQETWNHLVANTEKVYKHFEKKGVTNNHQDLDGLAFNSGLPPGGQPASSVMVRFSQGSYHKWIYDPIKGKYFRHQDAIGAGQGQEVFEPMIDRLNGQPVSADNVVVLLANHEYYSVDPEMVQIPFNGSGLAYIYREGHAYLVNWTRTADDEIITFSHDDGNPFPLKPGNTWFAVIGSTSNIQGESPDWQFQFYIP
jgi:hypothetical protein